MASREGAATGKSSSRLSREQQQAKEQADSATCTVTAAPPKSGASKGSSVKQRGGASSKKKGSASDLLNVTVSMLKATLGVCVLAIALMAVLPRPSELLPPFERSTEHDGAGEQLQHPQYTRATVKFSSGDANGTLLAAWRYLPTDWKEPGTVPRPPVIIMAHGLGAQRDFGLHTTADVFARAGFGVLVFDYRTFGASDGEPRHWVSPARHLEDWRAAIQWANSTDNEALWDASRPVLWGTSYSGGHVLVLSAQLQDRVAGVISQVPHLNAGTASGASLVTRGLFPSIRLFIAGVYDALRARLGLSPVYVRLAGPEGTVSVMALSEESMAAYVAKHPPNKMGGWRNQVLARFVLEGVRYSPDAFLRNITRPVLLAAAQYDLLCPPEAVHDAGTVLGVDTLIYPVDHFSLYLGQTWVSLVAHQLDFACNVTGLACPRDPTVELKELSTAIGARHAALAQPAQAGGQEGGAGGGDGDAAAAGEDEPHAAYETEDS